MPHGKFRFEFIVRFLIFLCRENDFNIGKFSKMTILVLT